VPRLNLKRSLKGAVAPRFGSRTFVTAVRCVTERDFLLFAQAALQDVQG
jgi:hypothetical protein